MSWKLHDQYEAVNPGAHAVDLPAQRCRVTVEVWESQGYYVELIEGGGAHVVDSNGYIVASFWRRHPDAEAVASRCCAELNQAIEAGRDLNTNVAM